MLRMGNGLVIFSPANQKYDEKRMALIEPMVHLAP